LVVLLLGDSKLIEDVGILSSIVEIEFMSLEVLRWSKDIAGLTSPIFL